MVQVRVTGIRRSTTKNPRFIQGDLVSFIHRHAVEQSGRWNSDDVIPTFLS
jgi:hypothetical protein